MSAIFFDSLETQVSSSTPHSIKTNGSQTTREYISNGIPEGSITAVVGSTCVDATTGNSYRKATGSGNTGWINSDGPGSFTWVTSTNAVLTGNRNVVKNVATAAWDEGAYSVEGYANGCYVSAKPIATNKALMFGLNSDPATNHSYTSIDYAIYLNSGASVQIYESGALKSTAYLLYTTSDIFSVVHDGVNILYQKNGVTFKTTARAVSTALYFDCTFYNDGVGLNDVHFGPISSVGSGLFTLVGSTSTAITANRNISKNSTSAAWDEGGYSLEGYANGCYASVQAKSVSLNQSFGLNSDPTTDHTLASIDYCILLSSAGDVYTYESGSLIGGIWTTFTVNDVFSIVYDGVNVSYQKNGVAFKTTARAVGAALYFDCSLHGNGSGFNNISFGPMGNSVILADGDKTDITVSSSGTVWTIDNDVVTNAKLANMTSGTIKGCVTSGDPVDLTPAQARLILRKAKNVLTFNATQNWDLNSGLYHTLTATGNFTLNLPSNIAEGETAFIYVKQDGTGSRILTLASGYQTPGGTQLVLSTTANAVDRLMFFFDTSSTCTATITKDIKTI